jgi:hypothetical protein
MSCHAVLMRRIGISEILEKSPDDSGPALEKEKKEQANPSLTVGAQHRGYIYSWDKDACTTWTPFEGPSAMLPLLRVD